MRSGQAHEPTATMNLQRSLTKTFSSDGMMHELIEEGLTTSSTPLTLGEERKPFSEVSESVHT